MRDAEPHTSGLVDQRGRRATTVRVSLTDRCNLRCVYCQSEQPGSALPGPDLLTEAELLRLIRTAVERLGVTRVRFTGGEPLLRRGLEGLIAGTLRLRTPHGAVPSIGVTTNGVGLATRARTLARAGLKRINVSLDTLDRDRFIALSRRDCLHDVLEGLEAARAAGLGPIKINTVLVAGINDGDISRLVRWALERGFLLRFIENMPLGPGGTWERSRMVSSAQIRGFLRETFRLSPVAPQTLTAGQKDPSPQRIWQVHDRRGRPLGPIGFISSITAPFCDSCNRTRLTADGKVRSCLFSPGETDLRGPLRSGADDEALAKVWQAAMWNKPADHGSDASGFARPDRAMNAIGG